MSIKNILKKIVPEPLILFYHFCLAGLAGFFYGYPSKKMVVVGVTGTKGKTSSANFIWKVLNSAGLKTGLITTANIRIGKEEFLNKYHMTMPGPFILQGILRQMAKSGCRFSVIETTSEGIKQFRHRGILYDVAVFTNLSPEHLPSHQGSFEKYRETKGKLFASLKGRKIIGAKKVEKITIVNYDSQDKNYFLGFKADKKITFGLSEGSDFQAKEIIASNDGVDFSVGNAKYRLSLMGAFNVYNALPAIALASFLNIPEDLIKKGLAELRCIPGRMEEINEGQDFRVFVDYAHEKLSMNALLDTAKMMLGKNPEEIIILLGAEGGGRDKAKRPLMGEIAAKKADFVIISNVDPYDDDPKEILEDIAIAAEAEGKKRNENLFVIEDRREGIKKALSLAKAGDIVLITGKGAEQSMIISGKHLPWDDRRVVREELKYRPLAK